MSDPRLESIHIARVAGARMLQIGSCHAIGGRGLENDRYAAGVGTFSKWPRDHELTLIEAETLDSLATSGFVLSPGDARRNLVTRGIRLNNLVDCEIQVGSIRLRGTRLCDPCKQLEMQLGLPGLAKALARRGGLRAIILNSGELSVGDRITVRSPLIQTSNLVHPPS